jgi:hypothetical protein
VATGRLAVVVVDTVTGGAVVTVVEGAAVVGTAVVDSGEVAGETLVVDSEGARTLAKASPRCELAPQATHPAASRRLASAARRRRFHTIRL